MPALFEHCSIISDPVDSMYLVGQNHARWQCTTFNGQQRAAVNMAPPSGGSQRVCVARRLAWQRFAYQKFINISFLPLQAALVVIAGFPKLTHSAAFAELRPGQLT